MGSKRLVTLGLFFMIGLGCVLFIAIFTKDFRQIFGEKKYLYVEFENVAGLREGDSVRVNGLELGRIDELAMNNEANRIVVRIALYRTGLVFYEGYKIKIQESSLIGGRFLNIIPKPDPQDVATPKKLGDYGNNEGQPLKGSPELPAFDKISQSMDRVNWDDISSAFKDLSKVLGEWQNQGKTTVENINRAAEELKKAIGSVNDGEFGRRIREDELYKDAVRLADESAKVAEGINNGTGAAGEMVKKISDLASQSRDLVQKLNDGSVGKSIHEDPMYLEMKKVAENLRSISEGLADRGGKAALPRLMHDDEMGAELKDMIHEMKEASANLNKVTRRLDRGEGTAGRMLQDDGLYKKADEALTSLNRTLGTFGSTKLFVDVEDKYYPDSMMNIAKAHITVFPRENKFLKIGAAIMSVDGESDLTTENNQFGEEKSESFTKLDIQLGYKFLDNRLTLRGGMIEGKPGAGIDYDWEVPGLDHDVRLTFEGRGSYNHVDSQDLDEHINGPLYRMEASTKVLRFFRPYLGASRLGNDAEFFGGVTFEYEDRDIASLIALLSAA
ncbi:MAG: MCE family protein, partial [Planctomycetes bacterium]|nr:MCE family protein [Planctomycetota bacterium]